MQRWLKLDQRFPFGQTTTRLLDEFGPPGLTVWVCLLAEAKRQVPEGHVEYVNDHHFWGLLGLVGHEPEFTVDAFLTFTGQLKQTRRTRSGRVSDVVLTRWHDWQDDWRRESERERKSRKRRESDADTLRTRNGQPADKKRTEKEIEIEIENTPLTPHGGNGVVKEIFEYYCTTRGKRVKLSDGRRRKIEARLKEFSPDDLRRAIDAVALDPWEERRRNDDLTQIFRSTETVDRFLAFDTDPALLSPEDRWKRHFKERQ